MPVPKKTKKGEAKKSEVRALFLNIFWANLYIVQIIKFVQTK